MDVIVFLTLTTLLTFASAECNVNFFPAPTSEEFPLALSSAHLQYHKVFMLVTKTSNNNNGNQTVLLRARAGLFNKEIEIPGGLIFGKTNLLAFSVTDSEESAIMMADLSITAYFGNENREKILFSNSDSNTVLAQFMNCDPREERDCNICTEENNSKLHCTEQGLIVNSKCTLESFLCIENQNTAIAASIELNDCNEVQVQVQNINDNNNQQQSGSSDSSSSSQQNSEVGNNNNETSGSSTDDSDSTTESSSSNSYGYSRTSILVGSIFVALLFITLVVVFCIVYIIYSRKKKRRDSAKLADTLQPRHEFNLLSSSQESLPDLFPTSRHDSTVNLKSFQIADDGTFLEIYDDQMNDVFALPDDPKKELLVS